jgi:hypothetical protein
VLAQALDLSTHLYPMTRPDPTSPGVARLDRDAPLPDHLTAGGAT